MTPADAEIRIGYFHDATDDHLHKMGVDRNRLPSRADWRSFYQDDCARPIRERRNYALVWEVDGRPVGFSSTDHIVFGEAAFMHLHILGAEQRGAGLGAAFVKKSVAAYFDVLELDRIFCEPNAFNVAPNRTLQRAGFRYLFTHETTPGPINFPQVTTRWVFEP